MQRLIMSPSSEGHLAFAETERPDPAPGEALVRVTAFSMNRGELVMASGPERAGRPIGWDFAGVVERAPADGGTPAVGTRVVGWRPQMDAWGVYVVSRPDFLAEIPASIEDEVAATLPVAGLTALAAIDRGSRLVGDRVLVTGVTGGVGNFAVQLAKVAGARVVAQVRHAEQTEAARRAGADEVVVTADGAGLEGFGPYRLVVDGVGGDLFGRLVPLVGKGGTLVSYGATSGATARVQMHPDLFGAGGQRSIYGLTLYTEIEHEPSARGLARLLRLVADGRVRSEIGMARPWTEAPALSRQLLDRAFVGKGVALIEP